MLVGVLAGIGNQDKLSLKIALKQILTKKIISY
jgi:hypothetical protein